MKKPVDRYADRSRSAAFPLGEINLIDTFIETLTGGELILVDERRNYQ